MSNQFWVSNGNSPSQGSGSALASSTTMTDISPAPQWTFPYYLYAGQRVRVSAYGRFSNASTPNLTLAVYYGGATSGTLLAGTGTVATASAVTGVPWRLSYNFRVASVGSSGTIVGEGNVDIGTSLTATTGVPIPNTNANPITISTVSLQTLTVAAQWGTNSSSDTITCEDFIVELLN
jgi:hypothetical protein